MEAGDYGNQGSEPWANRRRAIPKRTWTGKVVYPHPPSRRHFWRIEDARRVLDRLIVPENEDGTAWARKVVSILRNATIEMMGKILWFLDSTTIEEIYLWCIQLLDTIFAVQEEPSLNRQKAVDLIQYLADKAGLTVKFVK